MTGPDDTEALRAARLWSLGPLVPLTETATSRLYRTEAQGQPAVLKVLKPYGAEEIAGAGLLRWYAGQGAVRLLAADGLSMLLEWLDGAPLGDLVRDGGDARATEVFCDVIAALHAARGAPPPGLQPLHQRYRALLEAGPGDWPETSRAAFRRAAALAQELLASQPAPIPLHGDLHHDNVIGAGLRWRAIDPKGLTGDPACDLANIFRNPLGAETLAATPSRIAALADRFAAAGFDRRRTLGWAAAHCALSAVWDRAAGNPASHDLQMLPLLLAAAG